MSAEEYKRVSEQLDRIEQISLIGSKNVLNMDEAVIFTGFTKAFLYRQTSEKTIPHFKKNRKILFKKEELENWLLEHRVMTEAEIQSKAATYLATHR